MPWGHLVSECPEGRHPADAVEAFGTNLLRAANPQMPWGHFVFECPAGCHLLRCDSVLECAGRQPADAVEPFGI